MVGCHSCVANGGVLSPKRDLNPSGHGHYHGLFPRSHYTGLYARQVTGPRPPKAKSLRASHPRCHRRGSRMLGDASAGVPAGTVLRYTASWPPSSTMFSSGPSGVASTISPILASKWGISIDSETDASTFFTNALGFTLQVHTNSDYGAAADVKSIIDGEIYNARGAMPTSSISIINLAASDAASAAVNALTPLPAAAFDLPTFLSDNWPVLAIAGIGIVIAREVL